MGNLIMWDESPSDSDWTKTQVYKSSTEAGLYSLITTLGITDFTYYDSAGISTDFYKIRFTNNDLTEATDFSEAIQGKARYLYTDPKDVLRAAGLTQDTLPDSIDNNTIYDWIYDVSKNLDQATKKVYGRTEEFTETISSKYVDAGQTGKLNHKNISDIKVEFRLNIAPDEKGEYSWSERNEGYDYQVLEKEGKIKFFVFPLLMTPYNYNDIRITGTYGQSDIPTAIEQLTKYIAAIRIFVHITGGSYNDVTSWSLGEYNESLGEPYTNLRASIVMLETEIKKLRERTGITDIAMESRRA